jgi:hypothetical protein
MNGLYRKSSIRAISGASLILLALIMAVFLLPGASQERDSKRKAANDARRLLDQQEAELAALQKQWDQITSSQACLDELMGSMTADSIGQLQWQLHKRLYELAKKHTVNVHSVKYGAPSREGAKGTDLEALDVEFSATGVYQNLKPFMLALEGSKLPFAVMNVKLEESPEGARLNVTLRAFRHSGKRPAEITGGEA